MVNRADKNVPLETARYGRGYEINTELICSGTAVGGNCNSPHDSMYLTHFHLPFPH